MAISPGAPSGLPPLPSSNHPNSFPPKYLQNEVPLIETQPSTTPALMLLIAEIIMIAIMIADALINAGAIFYVVPPLLIVLVLTLYTYSKIWSLKNTHYAVTYDHVIVVYGRFGKKRISISHDQITAVELIEPWFINRLFGLGSIMFSVPSFSYSTVVWSNIRSPRETIDYINTIRQMISQHLIINSNLIQAGMIGNAVASNLGMQKICWNCKSPIPPNAKYCKYCGVKQP